MYPCLGGVVYCGDTTAPCPIRKSQLIWLIDVACICHLRDVATVDERAMKLSTRHATVSNVAPDSAIKRLKVLELKERLQMGKSIISYPRAITERLLCERLLQ